MGIAQTKIGKYTINGYENDYIFEALKSTHAFYETATLDLWSPIFKNAQYIFDIGANLGNHSLYWAEALHPKAIYAFEPYAPNYTVLAANIEQNHLSDTIVPINKAVGERAGYAKIANLDETNLGGTTFAEAESAEEGAADVVSVDEFIAQTEAIPRVDLVKIDTEGFELSVIKGMTHTLTKYKPIVWVEVSYASYRSVSELLEQCGYFCYDIQQFNLLFLPSERYAEKSNITEEYLLDRFLYYQERTNAYYKNYLKAKEWLDAKNNSYENLSQQYARRGEELASAKAESRGLEGQLESAKAESRGLEGQLVSAKAESRGLEGELASAKAAYHALQEQLTSTEETLQALESEHAELQMHCREMQEYLSNKLQSLNQDIALITEIKAALLRTQAQNMQLQRENEIFKRHYEQITGSWYGRFALRCYRLLRRLKAAIKR